MMPISKRDDSAIIHAARQIGGRQATRDYLWQACQGDAAQLDRITARLRGDETDGQFVELPAEDLPPLEQTSPTGVTLASDATSLLDVATPSNELPGTTIGPYTIRELLGKGGMGVVYVAEQKEPVRRKVALKIIKPGMDSAEVLARFDAERQALAMMSHPNIAKILDGGRTESGRPYFVMELVRGVPITEFCDAQKLDLRERLVLFVTVCQAVQHAHRKGIIHRDLKPSNVLIELHDVAPMPKVIDFGVAKAIDTQLTQQTIYTHYSQLIGTPLYMSPEQAQLSGLDVDTRSDVYSLGVMLYELLAGVLPFDRKTLSHVGLDEWRRIIREDEPQRPSDKVSKLNNETISTISSLRRSSPRDLSLSMRRELDWIVMKTLEKDRDRRYGSASDLAADIQRFLNDEPVEAHPPSPTYRLRKFARKNRTGIVTTSIVAAALITGTSVSSWLAHEANEARHLAHRRFLDADEQRQHAVRAAELAKQNEEVSRQLVYAADVNLAAQARESGDVRRFTRFLDRHVPLDGEVDRRGFEWWFLRQFAEAGFHNIAIETGGTCVAQFSPDGNYLVTGRYDGSVCFWDGQSENLLAVKRGHERLTRGIDFSPDGIHMASIGDDGIIRIWDLATQKQIRSFQAHNNHGFRVFYVNDGQTLASCGEDSSVMLWDSTTGEPLGELKDYARTVERAAMNRSADGRYCASGDPTGYAYVWDTSTNKRLCQLDLGLREGVRCAASCVSFSPDGRFVAIGTDENLICICDAQTGALIQRLVGHEDDLQDVTFHPSGRLLASSDLAGVIRVWPIGSGGELLEDQLDAIGVWPRAFQAHSARLWALDFSPDGSRLVSASKDGTVRSWSGRTPAQLHMTGTGRETIAMTFSASGNEAYIAGERNLRVWNRQTDEIRFFGERFNETAYCVAISPDGQTCVTGHDEGWIRLWSCKTGQLIRATQGHNASVDEIKFSPDGQMLATAGWDGKAILWDPRSGEQLAVFEMYPHCYSVAFSPDSRLLACSSEDDAMIYEIATRELLHRLKGHQSSAECVTFSPDGRWLASGSADRTVRIWNVETGQSEHVIAANQDEIISIAFSADGTTIASGGKTGTVSFSHVSTGRFLMDTKVGSDRVKWLDFSQGGDCLAAAVDEKGIQLLYAPQTQPTAELPNAIAEQ